LAAATADPVLKAAYFVAANHAVLQTEFAWPYSYLAGFAGWILISAVMRESSAFGKWLGTFGLVASCLFVIDMALVYMIPGVAGGFVLPLQWVFVVFWIIAGVRLFSLGRKKNQLEMTALAKKTIDREVNWKNRGRKKLLPLQTLSRFFSCNSTQTTRENELWNFLPPRERWVTEKDRPSLVRVFRERELKILS